MLAAVPSDTVGTLLGWAFRPLSDAMTPQARVIRIVLLVASTLVMCMGDLYMTLTFAINIGMIEANPIARSVMQEHPIAVVVIWKVATVLFFSVVLFLARRTRAAELAAWCCFIVMTALTVHWFSYSSNVSGYTTEFAALAMAEDPRWINLTGEQGANLHRLARSVGVAGVEGD